MLEVSAMPDFNEQNFHDLIRDMKECDFTFLLGGGASLSSGVTSPGALAKEWFRILWKYMNDTNPPAENGENAWVPAFLEDEANWSEYINSEVNIKHIADALRKRDYDDWFRLASFVIDGIPNSYFAIATMLEDTHPAGKRKILEATAKIADDANPSIGYKLMAKLMATPRSVREYRQIKHDAVITTNFDEMLRQGFFSLRNEDPNMRTSLTNPHCITISDNDVQLDAIADYLEKRDRPLIYHIHNSQDFNPRNTVRDVSYYTPKMNEALRRLIEGRCLLVMGYSGSDEGLMTVLKEAVEKSWCKRIYWLCFREQIPDNRPFKRLRKVIGNNLLLLNCPDPADFESCPEECEEGFDSFMFKLFVALFDGQPANYQKTITTKKPIVSGNFQFNTEPISNVNSPTMVIETESVNIDSGKRTISENDRIDNGIQQMKKRYVLKNYEDFHAQRENGDLVKIGEGYSKK